MITAAESTRILESDSGLLIYVPVKLDPEFLRDVLGIAICGGINYWANITEQSEDYCDIAPMYPALPAVPECPDDFQSQPLTLAHLVAGIRRATEKGACALRIRKAIMNAIHNQDAGCIDDECADVIVQLALFNEIVYS